MSALAIIIIVFVLLVVLLIVGGLIANARRTRGQEDELHFAVREADQALALARAGDRAAKASRAAASRAERSQPRSSARAKASA